jgi:hypothetical protein
MWKAATVRCELVRNPMEGIKTYSTRTAKTYSVEQPNALNPRTQIAEFLDRLKTRYPRWYAFTLMGFILGQRPSTLRPLRRRGPNADVDLVNKKVYIRRSHTNHGRQPGEKDLVMETTKTGNELALSSPDELVEVLKWHIAMIDASPIGQESDLLFPSPFTGRMLSHACLRTPWKNVLNEMGLSDLKLTPRAMRRTYQDLADEARCARRPRWR